MRAPGASSFSRVVAPSDSEGTVRVLRRSLLSTLGAGLALAGVVTFAGSAHADVTPAQAADYAAGWLGRTMDPTGYVPSLGGADYNTTALSVLALVAAEVGGEQAQEATDYLFAHVDAYVKDDDANDRPAALAALILVGHAMGEDVTALVTRLLATQRADGPDAGLFGVQGATYDGTYRQAFALLALAAVGQTDAEAVAWLKAEQCDDGGWMANRPDTSAPCPAFDYNSFVGEDSNGTALAAQALAALGETPLHDPLDFLAEAQNEDGGFAFVPGFGSDTNSTALAIQALIALGEDLDDWAAPDGTPYDFLLAMQLGNPPATTAGALAFQPGQGGTLTANAFATAQAVPALAGKAFPLAPATLSNELPLLPAEVVATPSVTASVTPSVAPTTAVTPVPRPSHVITDFGPVPELPDTGPVGDKPWDATGQAVFALGLVGYGALALGGAKLAARRGKHV